MGHSKNNSTVPVLTMTDSGIGLAVGRALARHGVKVYGIDTGFSVGRFSKYIEKPSWGYSILLDQKLLDNLVMFSRQFDTKPVFIPTYDVMIEFVAQNFDVLKEYYHLHGVYSPEISFKFLNKKEFYTMCEDFNIPYPRTIFLNGGITIGEIWDRMKPPFIIKPHMRHKWKRQLRGEKVILINTRNEFDKILQQYPDLMGKAMVQEVIPGPESNIYLFKGYFDRSGKLVDYFTGRKLRQFPPMFGSGSLVESIPGEEVKEASMKFFQNVKVHGLGGIEFKHDPRDGKLKMIEINMRPQTWEDITRVSGKELLWLSYCDLVGLPCHNNGQQIFGIKLVDLIPDTVSALWFMSKKRLSFREWFKSYKGRKAYALIDLKDFGTLFGAISYSILQFTRYRVQTSAFWKIIRRLVTGRSSRFNP